MCGSPKSLSDFGSSSLRHVHDGEGKIFCSTLAHIYPERDPSLVVDWQAKVDTRGWLAARSQSCIATLPGGRMNPVWLANNLMDPGADAYPPVGQPAAEGCGPRADAWNLVLALMPACWWVCKLPVLIG